MFRIFFIILAAILVEAYQPKFQIFEIRKTRDHDHRLDDQYYDPDSERLDSIIHREKDKKRFLDFAEDIAKYLQRLSQRKQTHSSDSSDDYTEFVDETRTLVVMPKKKLSDHLKIDGKNILEKIIQSALRTQVEDVEDRTAAPRHRIPYEYDYD